jgi:hypothetical protein
MQADFAARCEAALERAAERASHPVTGQWLRAMLVHGETCSNDDAPRPAAADRPQRRRGPVV